MTRRDEPLLLVHDEYGDGSKHLDAVDSKGSVASGAREHRTIRTASTSSARTVRCDGEPGEREGSRALASARRALICSERAAGSDEFPASELMCTAV